MSFTSSSDKVCFNKNLPIVLFGLIILLGVVFFSQSLMNTKNTTKTKAAYNKDSMPLINTAIGCQDLPLCTGGGTNAFLYFDTCTGACDEMVKNNPFYTYDPKKVEFTMCRFKNDSRVVCKSKVKETVATNCEMTPTTQCSEFVMLDSTPKASFDYCDIGCASMLERAGISFSKTNVSMCTAEQKYWCY